MRGARYQRGDLIFECDGRHEAIVDDRVRGRWTGTEPHAGGEPSEVRQLG
jgi:hypothetical protein